jgi:hypothetical protein
MASPFFSCNLPGSYAHDVETQRLARKGLIDYSGDGLLPIGCGLAVVDLPVVAVGDADDDSRACRYCDAFFKVFLIDPVPDRGVVIQPVCLPGLRYLDFPVRPIRCANQTADLEVGMLGVRSITAGDRSGLENSPNVQGHIVDCSGFSAKRE